MPGGGPSPREDPRVARSRQAVIDAATELLLADGLAAVTVEAVLARSGVARSTLYRHWPGRAELLVDVLRRLVPPSTTTPPPGPFRHRLEAIALQVARELQDPESAPLIATLLHAAHFDPELSAFCDQFTRDKRAPLEEVLAAARAVGDLRDDVTDDDVVTLLIGPMFMRTVMMRLPIGDAWVLGHVDRVHCAVVRR
jgi:AcrR family transcriptional regulator